MAAWLLPGLEDQMKKKSCHLQDLSYPEVVKKTSADCYKSLKSFGGPQPEGFYGKFIEEREKRMRESIVFHLAFSAGKW